MFSENIGIHFICSAEALSDLREAGLIPGWRNEQYPVLESFCKEPYMLIERAAAVPFGIKANLELKTSS